MVKRISRTVLALLFLLTGCSSKPDGVTLHPVDIEPIRTHSIRTQTIEKSETAEEVPIEDRIGHALISGDVWQASLAQDPNADYSSILEFLEFHSEGILKWALFSGESSTASWSVEEGSLGQDGSYEAVMQMTGLEKDGQILTGPVRIQLLPGKNLDQKASIDYSSLLLTFENEEFFPLTIGSSGMTLLTTSGLSSQEADAWLIEQKEKQIQPVTNPLIANAETIEEACWNFFLLKGLSPEQTAGILGNIKIESDFNPDIISSSGSYFGLFQLTSQRRAAMEEMGGKESFINQLEYIWVENFEDDHPYSNKNYRAMQDNFFGTDPRGGCIDFNESGHTVEEYAVAFMMNVERCYTPQTDWQKPSERAAYARAYYNLFTS